MPVSASSWHPGPAVHGAGTLEPEPNPAGRTIKRSAAALSSQLRLEASLKYAAVHLLSKCFAHRRPHRLSVSACRIERAPGSLCSIRLGDLFAAVKTFVTRAEM